MNSRRFIRTLAPLHSITLSARRTSEGGTSNAIALATPVLITSSKAVGCSTDISLGLAPRRTFPNRYTDATDEKVRVSLLKTLSI